MSVALVQFRILSHFNALVSPPKSTYLRDGVQSILDPIEPLPLVICRQVELLDRAIDLDLNLGNFELLFDVGQKLNGVASCRRELRLGVANCERQILDTFMD